MLALLIAALTLPVLTGCQNGGRGGSNPSLRDLDQPVPLPGLEDGPTQPADQQRVPMFVVQRMDLPLDMPLDSAWSQIDEQAFPAITRGAWHANGLRIGVLHEAQVAGFAEQVPQVVNFFEKTVITRSHPVSIMQAAPLRPDTRFAMDLTLPPQPAHEMVIDGRQGGQLQLLARLEIEGERTYVVITPHLYRPKPNDFSSRPLLERDLDGQVFHELSIRVELQPDRLVAIGLYWPWSDEAVQDQLDNPPTDETRDQDDATGPTDAQPGEVVVDTQVRDELSDLDSVLTRNDVALDDDPAAPPQRVRTSSPTPAPQPQRQAEEEDEPAQAMPALPMHFGRVLLTGTRARKPVQTMLLISIPAAATGEAPAPSESNQPPK